MHHEMLKKNYHSNLSMETYILSSIHVCIMDERMLSSRYYHHRQLCEQQGSMKDMSIPYIMNIVDQWLDLLSLSCIILEQMSQLYNIILYDNLLTDYHSFIGLEKCPRIIMEVFDDNLLVLIIRISRSCTLLQFICRI